MIWESLKNTDLEIEFLSIYPFTIASCDMKKMNLDIQPTALCVA